MAVNLSSFVSPVPNRPKPGTQKDKAMFRNFKVLFAVLAVLVIAGSAYAFAAANDIQASAGGYAATVVSGYTTSSTKYDLHVDDPTLVDKSHSAFRQPPDLL
jgi:hypothetical protein